MAIINGNGSNNIIYGTTGRDEIGAGGGNDKVYGKVGNDRIDGGAGADFLTGDSGSDYVLGGDGDDYVMGGADFDQLFGGNGNDRLLGGEGTDDVHGGVGNDAIVLELYGLCKENDFNYYGDGGTDTLIVKTPGEISLYPEDVASPEDSPLPAITSISMGGNGHGTVAYICDSQENSNTVRQGEIYSIERIETERSSNGADSRLDYSGGASNMTVKGGGLDDVFWLGSGKEYISTGAGHDVIGINLGGGRSMGHDVVYDFAKASDKFVLMHGGVEDGFTFRQTESGGNTYIAGYNAGGLQVVDLTVMGVTGLGPIQSSQDWWG